MPGVSIAKKLFNSSITSARVKVEKSLSSVLFHEDYKASKLWSDDGLLVFKTCYESYPVRKVENKDFLIIIEGLIYNKKEKDIDAALVDIAYELSGSTGKKDSKLCKFVNSIDGDYVVYIIERKQGMLFVINDGLGRLPLYFFHEKNEICLSRELRFLINYIDSPQLDPIGFSQAVLIGFPLGEFTFYKKIQKVLPGSLVIIDNNGVTTTQIFEMDFDLLQEKKEEITEQHIDSLTELFVESCKNRSQTHPHSILSLSGGLDSRAVAAGFINSDCFFQSLSFLDHFQHAYRDIKIAQEIAKICNCDWDLVKLKPISRDMIFDIVDLQVGMSSVSVGELLQFEEYIVNKFKRLNSGFSGDGGDKAIPYLLDSPVMNEEMFFESLLKYQTFTGLGVEAAARALGVSEQKAMDSVMNHVSKYPEASWSGKYLHYIIYERGLKYMVGGPERVRYFHWAHCPFYSLPFFINAMEFHQETKKDYFLYKKFLSRLSAEIAAVPYNSLKKQYNDNRQKARVFFFYYLPEKFRKTGAKVFDKIGLQQNPVLDMKQMMLKQQLEQHEEVNTFHQALMKNKELPDLDEDTLDVLLQLYGVIEETLR